MVLNCYEATKNERKGFCADDGCRCIVAYADGDKARFLILQKKEKSHWDKTGWVVYRVNGSAFKQASYFSDKDRVKDTYSVLDSKRAILEYCKNGLESASEEERERLETI